jgi:aldehyde dehydrogenase (NAD+)
MSIPQINHFINGEIVSPVKGNYGEVHNPATGEVIAHYAKGTSEDVDLAVKAARAAYNNPEWRNMPVDDRVALLHKIAGRIKQHFMELCQLEVMSSGGTISRVTSVDMPGSLMLCNAYAEMIKNYTFIEDKPVQSFPEPMHVQTLKEPLGVCGFITPWNVPLMLFLVKCIPAIATGNTVVVKPSELTPHTTLKFAEITADLLPPGVINVVNGTGPDVGEAITTHHDVNKIAFTGSTAVGKHIFANCAQTMKRVSLELGGKSPAIVMPDADIDRTAYGLIYGIMNNAGQICLSGSRALVPEALHDPLVERLVEVAAQLKVGDPFDPQTSYGPMSTPQHGEKVMGFIERAKADGAIVACGGNRMTIEGYEGGFFVEPTVLTHVTNDMDVSCNEIFGPVLSVLKYKDVEEAITIANDTKYGLGGGIWTEDVVAAQQVARRMETGMVWINDWHFARLDTPLGGYKESGYGREMGVMGLENFLETKTIFTSFERQSHKKAMTYGAVHKKFG